MSQAAHAVGIVIPITSAAAPAVNYAVGRSQPAEQHARMLSSMHVGPAGSGCELVSWGHCCMSDNLSVSMRISACFIQLSMPAVRCEVRIPFQ